MEKISFRHNVMSINSIKSFYGIRGGYSNNVRDVYFVRALGEIPNLNAFITESDQQMDVEMAKGKLVYKRISSLPLIKDVADSQFYSELYAAITNNRTGSFRKLQPNRALETVIAQALAITIGIYKETRTNVSASMIQNLGTKLLFWLDQEMEDCLKTWSEKACIKVVSDNVVKEQEYLFYLFLTYLGCDVLLIENRGDIVANEQLLQYSDKLKIGDWGNTELTKANPEGNRVKLDVKKVKKDVQKGNREEQKIEIRKPEVTKAVIRQEADLQTEKSYEELAQLASSVVMIAVHDKDGKVIGTGSGIMIGRNGFILTNHHVAAGGYFYSVRIEDEEEAYVTDEVIKYNQEMDLAIIRIRKELNPIPIYKGKNKLVRGQRVVAIGSPLGLFNSVSDGIISGFRRIDDVDMIQFTAPISHGSSGGAVLNMQGEVIGISTAGFDNGQNINLAVGYEYIQMFSSGFTS